MDETNDKADNAENIETTKDNQNDKLITSDTG